MLVELFNDSILSVEAALKKLEITEEKFFEYVERYRECN